MSLRELAAIAACAAVILVSLQMALDGRELRGIAASQHDPQRRALAMLAAVLALGFIGLVGRLLYVSVIRAGAISNRTDGDDSGEVLSNPRRIEAALNAGRGRILDRNGTVLSETRTDGGQPVRVAVVPAAAHILGYFSPLRYGLTGVEGSRDAELTGREPLTVREAIAGIVRQAGDQGHDVRLTIDSQLQQLAADLLDGVVGSAILMEAKSGRILAMASSPAYDPNELSTSRQADIVQADQAWQELLADESQPLLLRATSGLYPPGSTFKVVTASAGIDRGVVEPGTTFDDPGSLTVNGRVIPEFNRPDESKTVWTVAEGLAWSLNVVYAQIGLAIGAADYRAALTDFGIGSSIPFELPVEAGQISARSDGLEDEVALADTAFGQGELLVTPLHMAMVMCAVVNGGRILAPRLIDAVLNSDGSPGVRAEPETWRRPISDRTAGEVLSMLYESTAYGYASRASIPGLNVAGKTGTAESGREAPHGWFIGAAGVDSPTTVVSVCLDYGGEGGGLALDVGRALLDASVIR